MKAKIKASGEIIEVTLVLESMYRDISTSGIDEKMYYESELEFFPDTHEEVTIEGWVAVDEAYCGEAYLHTEKPHAESVEFCDTGDYEIAWRSDGKSYLLDRDLFPDMNTESQPKRVKITITPMDE